MQLTNTARCHQMQMTNTAKW